MRQNRSESCRRIGLATMLMAAVACPGCIAGSLASSTGPRPPAHHWSVAPKQMVHTGENVRFDFVLQDWQRRLVQPLALADYCVVMIGQERIETEPDIHGHFGFSHTFDSLRPGDAQVVTVTAYQQRAGRDWMKINGRWLHSDSPYEQADRKVTGDSIVLEAYQSAIELSIARPSHDLDVETGVLNIRRTDGTTTAVYVDRPAREGYALTGPDGSGLYHLRYLPRAIQLNPTGTTDVEFTIHDKSGRPHRQSISLSTP